MVRFRTRMRPALRQQRGHEPLAARGERPGFRPRHAAMLRNPPSLGLQPWPIGTCAGEANPRGFRLLARYECDGGAPCETTQLFAPVGFTRTPKRVSIPSHANASFDAGLRASTSRFVMLACIIARSVRTPRPTGARRSGRALVVPGPAPADGVRSGPAGRLLRRCLSVISPMSTRPDVPHPGGTTCRSLESRRRSPSSSRS
jgi:hypothetical protein